MIPLYNPHSFNERKIIPFILQIGLGGTGSAIAQQVSQMLSITEKGTYILADPDIVEAKNIRNQLFTNRNIGKPKAEILAQRYSAAYEHPCYAYTEGYIEDIVTINRVFSLPILNEEYSYNDVLFPIVIGAVDNNYTRQIMHDFFHHESVENLVYLDAGNESVVVPSDYPSRPREKWTDEEKQAYDESGWSGQVVCGVKRKNKVLLDPVADLYPDILTDQDTIAPSSLSCEEVSSSDPQRLITNRYAAMAVTSYVADIIENGCVTNHQTVFHAKRGYMRSQSISKE